MKAVIYCAITTKTQGDKEIMGWLAGKREGNTIDQIHDIMLEEGVVVSRSAIGNYVQGINSTE